MKIGIITPMAEEKLSLIAALDNTKTKQHGGTSITTGTYKGHEVILTESGIGKVAAASAATVMIDNFEPDLIVNTGSAGALDPDLKIGDEVVGTRVAHSDVDVTVFGYAFGQVPNKPLYYLADPEVVADFEKLAAVKEGLIVSDLANGDSGVVFDDYVVEAGRASAKLLLRYLDQKK